MQFHKLVAIVAISTLAIQAGAQNLDSPSQGVVIVNSNTNSNANESASNASQQTTATQQPTTVVEANPVLDSRAEQMRRARQNAEMQTEQKIVEKLEESRLREEQERAERLFGNKLESSAAAATATAVSTPEGSAATATAVSIAPEVKEEKPTQVTIEKVEIVTPAPAPAPIIEDVGESKLSLAPVVEEERKDRFFISGILAAPSYSASNVKSNFGLGVSLGVITKNNVGLEGTFLFSNHSVDTFWKPGLYSDLDQYDFGVSAKYYFFPNRLKPYVGGSITYIYREYVGRIKQGAWWVNPSEEESTHAVNMGLLAGIDFEVSENFMLGAGFDWNFNVMNKVDFSATDYGLPANARPLEEIGYYTLKVNAKVTF